jgi:hypothetical protein
MRTPTIISGMIVQPIPELFDIAAPLNDNQYMEKTLKEKYIVLGLRTLLLILIIVPARILPQAIAFPQPFFARFSPLHLLWLFWMLLFIKRLFPTGQTMMAGKKIFARYNDVAPGYSKDLLKKYVKNRNAGMLRVVAAGAVCVIPFYILYLTGSIHERALVIYAVFLFALDMVFEIFFCPFQVLFMKNRCCHVCRIYNWNSLLIISPLLIIPSFFSWSLAIVALSGLVEGEIAWLRHPEYFWNISNKKLRCTACTKKMCAVRKPIREKAL